METRDGRTFLVQHKKSPSEEEKDLFGESGRLTKSKKSKKSAKERHDQVMAQILKFYKNPNNNWKMITDDKAHRDKLKSLAPKMKFGRKI